MMLPSTNNSIQPSILLVEQLAFVSETVSNILRVEFSCHAILECGDNFVDVENFSPELKLIVISNSMLLNVHEKLKNRDLAHNCFGEVPVALLGDAADDASLQFLEQFNLKGVFPDDTPTNTLIAGLKFILAGGQYFPTKFKELKSLPGASGGRESHYCEDIFDRSLSNNSLTMNKVLETADPFTIRERAVLDCLAKGQPNKVIEIQLGIAENTIKIHIRNILKKLSVSNRTEAVLAAHKMSLVELH